MLKLSRYLKPFLPSILVVMVLLFAQTISELLLPNLMGEIVNVGIQQGGIEESSPRALSQDGMRLLRVVMDADGQVLLDECYSLVTGSDLDSRGRPYSETWPEARTARIYVRNDISKESLARLDDSFGLATRTLLNLLQNLQGSSVPQDSSRPSQQLPDNSRPAPQNEGPEDAKRADPGGAEATRDDPAGSGLDVMDIYPLLPALESLPQETVRQAQTKASEDIPRLRKQSAIVLISAFYSELGTDMPAIEMSYITRVGLIMLAVTTLTGIATVVINYLTTRIGTGVARSLRTVVFSKVASFSHTEFDRFSTASLITRSTNDVMMMQRFVGMGLRQVCHAPILGIGAAIMAVNKSASMSWIIVVAVAIIIGAVMLQISIVTPRFRLVQTLTDKLNLVAREKLTGLMVIRAFNRDDVEMKRFDNANNDLTKTHLFIGRVMTAMGPFMTIIMNGMSILIIWVGGQQVAQAKMQVGDMMAYMQYIMQVMMSFMQLSMIFNMIPRAQVSADRIVEVLETTPAITDPLEPRTIEADKRGMIEFRNVSFRYEGAEEDALQDISFKALPGQTVAFIGPTGSGKTSVMNLIPRFYDVAEGAVLVGDVDVRDLSQKELRSNIGYVPQKSILMGGTIASNVAYGVSEGLLNYDDYIDIAVVAQAIDFIAEKEAGFYTPVSQGGTNVSGGQRQRLAVARALAVNPSIYLFDDSFSALDFTTDAALRKALREHTADSTLLIVSQRIGTIMDADMIHVVEEGRIIGSGTHDELLVSCPTYYEIASTQLAELARAEELVSLSEGGA